MTSISLQKLDLAEFRFLNMFLLFKDAWDTSDWDSHVSQHMQQTVVTQPEAVAAANEGKTCNI